MELRLDPRLVLLLGIVLANVPQSVAPEEVSCNETQYLEEDLNRCCNRCPPGQFRKKECTNSSETECQPCGPGTYAAQWNYAGKCRKCGTCTGNNIVEREPCSATQAAICGCADGYICAQYDGLNKCMFCKANPSIEATEAPADEPEEHPPDMKNTWIIIGVVLFIVTSFVVIVCLKARLLKKFGRMIKNKSCSESTPQPETGEAIAVPGTVNGGRMAPLVKNGPITSENLRYPVPVSDETDMGEFALLTG